MSAVIAINTPFHVVPAAMACGFSPRVNLHVPSLAAIPAGLNQNRFWADESLNQNPFWVEEAATFTIPVPARGRQPIKLLVYGDSLTAGLHGLTQARPSFEPYAKSLSKHLASAGIPVEIHGCGLCGSMAIEFARNLDGNLYDVGGRYGLGLRRILKEHGPFDLVLIMAGTNDIPSTQVAVPAILTAIKELHSACHAVAIPSVAFTLPESEISSTHKFPKFRTKWLELNKEISSWVQGEQRLGKKHLHLVDSNDLLRFNRDTLARGFWEPDCLHFSSAGSTEFGARLAKLIAPLLLRLRKQQSQYAHRSTSPAGTIPSRPRSASDTIGYHRNDTPVRVVPIVPQIVPIEVALSARGPRSIRSAKATMSARRRSPSFRFAQPRVGVGGG